ncbi:hypothetical protein PM10SUCC1_32360 [Propionigenium maris DSM 9537]|uniref:Uncharacterized protein n=1 Tax=Propionigenium maris DSM 9537 TaxID=1123000 RepID=A0A9W6LPL6_9FUSO|nr:hypothetical protein [Propionigenium maris]GLI57722.1 hypothetical protein PM10SUCC1_32360 [Propionigenium maris DSM 9537]
MFGTDVNDLGNVNIVISATGLATVNLKNLDDDGYTYKTGYKTESKTTTSGFTAHSVQREPGSIGFNLPRDSDEYDAIETFINGWFELPKRPAIQIVVNDRNNNSTVTGINMAPAGDHEGGRNNSADQGFGLTFNGVVKKAPIGV